MILYLIEYYIWSNVAQDSIAGIFMNPLRRKNVVQVAT